MILDHVLHLDHAFHLEEGLQIEVLPRGDTNKDRRLDKGEIQQPHARAKCHLRLRLVLVTHLILKITHCIHGLVQIFYALFDGCQVLRLSELHEVRRITDRDLHGRLCKVALALIREANLVRALLRRVEVKETLLRIRLMVHAVAGRVRHLDTPSLQMRRLLLGHFVLLSVLGQHKRPLTNDMLTGTHPLFKALRRMRLDAEAECSGTAGASQRQEEWQ
mmetsp:Transcript_17002/g.43679  ORF Transcript_17002/g.43679 Transcript_17002/m.43679 type:complete len:219 (+) Transcript_17002:821-1477(+)